MEVGTEADWVTGSSLLMVPSGQSVTLVYELAGTTPLDGGHSLGVRSQPIVIDEELVVSVVHTEGGALVSFEGPSTQARVLGD